MKRKLIAIVLLCVVVAGTTQSLLAGIFAYFALGLVSVWSVSAAQEYMLIYMAKPENAPAIQTAFMFARAIAMTSLAGYWYNEFNRRTPNPNVIYGYPIAIAVFVVGSYFDFKRMRQKILAER